MSSTLYFVRHGETQASQAVGFCGDLSAGFSTEGSPQREVAQIRSRR